MINGSSSGFFPDNVRDLFTKRISYMRSLFNEDVREFMQRPENWLNSLFDEFEAAKILDTLPICTQIVFLKNRLANRTNEKIFLRSLIQFLRTENLDRDEKIKMLLILSQIPMQNLYRNDFVISGGKISDDELDRFSNMLAINEYIALKSGKYDTIRPASDVSLDSICLCAFAVAESSFKFQEHEIEKIQAVSFVASLLIAPYLHVNEFDVAEYCVRTLSYLPEDFHADFVSLLEKNGEEYRYERSETISDFNVIPLAEWIMPYYEAEKIEAKKQAEFLRRGEFLDANL